MVIEIGRIIEVNQKVIDALNTQKARNIDLIKRYKQNIVQEIGRPQNKYLEWSPKLEPFIDSTESAEVINASLIIQYQQYVEKLIDSFAALKKEMENKPVSVVQEISQDTTNMNEVVGEIMETLILTEKEIIEVKRISQIDYGKLVFGKKQQLRMCRVKELLDEGIVDVEELAKKARLKVATVEKYARRLGSPTTRQNFDLSLVKKGGEAKSEYCE